MKKIALFVGFYPNPADIYMRSFFRNLIEAIADSGVECHVVAPVSVTKYRNQVFKVPRKTVDYTKLGTPIYVYHPRYISYSAKNLKIVHTGVFSEKSYQRAAINAAKKIDKQFDFVYGHFFLQGGLAAIRIGNMMKIPSYVAFGECDYESQVQKLYGDLTKEEIRGLTGIISVSTKNANVLKDLGIFNDIPILIAPNAVNHDLFKKMNKNQARDILEIPRDVFLVGFVGSFIERKGDKRLLQAINSTEGVCVAFAGKGDEPPKGDKVVFCKPLPHADIPTFMNSLDVFCLPTLSEGSCNAIAEAMACGIPVISSDLPFNDDAMTNENSIRIDPTSVDEIKKAIVKLKDNKELLNSLGELSYQTSKRFSIEKRAEKILDFIYCNKDGICLSDSLR